MRGRRTQYIHALHQRHGAVFRLTPTEVAIADAAAAKQIHKPGGGYDKAAWYTQFVQGNAAGMFDMSDAKMHAARRRLFARAFGKSEIRGRWEGMVREKVELAVRRVGEELRRGEESDLLKWWTFMATDVSGHLMFGESFRMLEHGEVGAPVLLTLHFRRAGFSPTVSLHHLQCFWLAAKTSLLRHRIYISPTSNRIPRS